MEYDMEHQAHEPDYFEDMKTPEDLAAELAERLQVFATRLSKMASEQVARRSQIESRWLEDLRQYHGEYTPTELDRLRRANGSEVFVNITRNKCNAAEARLQDMLFPTDDRNFGIRPTPVPELEKAMEQGDGDWKAAAQAVMAEAESAAEAMQLEIDDQLNESRYQTKARDVIHDACQLGTAVLKGPIIVGRTEKRWDTLPDGTSLLQITESLRPFVERVDPWDFFPDMSARCIDEAEFIFERKRMSKKQLREMARIPGVLTDQLRELVKTEGRSSHLAKDHTDDIRAITGINTVGEGNKFEVWEYHGPISKSELIDALESAGSMDETEIDELDDEIEAVVVFSGQSVLKVVLNPMDTHERPFSVFNWEKDESTIFGFGVPYLMRNPQKVINASWRMMMDNAGLSVADQILLNRDLVEPADGKWTMTPKKVWYLRDKNRNVNEVFASFNTRSHQAELGNIFTMARQLADEETNLPLIAQGEQSSHVTKTASGMSMLMNSANIVLRKAVKNWDDDITRPLITRFYDWNMQFSDKPAIKGDFSVDARGSGALLVREKQQENLMIYANLSAQNPMLAGRRDWAGLDREIAKALEVPYDNLTLGEEEIQQAAEAQAQMPDPATQAAQMEAQLEQAKLQLRQQEVAYKTQESQGELQLKQMQIQSELELAQAKMMQDRELRMAELAAKAQVTERQLQARMAIDSEKIKTDRDKAATDANIRMTTTQLQANNLGAGYDTF